MRFKTSQQIDKIIQINLKYEVRSKFKPITWLNLARPQNQRQKISQTITQIYKNLDFALPQQRRQSRANLGSFAKFS